MTTTVKISELPAATSVPNTALSPIVVSGVTQRASVSQLPGGIAGSVFVTTPIATTINSGSYINVPGGSISIGSAATADKFLIRLSADLQGIGSEMSGIWRIVYTIDGGSATAFAGSTSAMLIPSSGTRNYAFECYATGLTAASALVFLVQLSGGDTVSTAITIPRVSLVVQRA